MSAVLILGSASYAKPKITVSIAQLHEVVRTQNRVRTSQWVPAKSTTPGEQLSYELHYANEGDEPATNAVIEDPIPKGTTYVPGSAAGEGAAITFSTDGGKTFSATPAKGAAVTHVRWTLAKVAPGQSGKVSLRVLVNR